MSGVGRAGRPESEMATVLKYGTVAYVAQAAVGFALGLVYPWLVFIGVL